MFIDAGADVNAKDDSDSTVLLHATIHGNTEVVKLLVDKNADINPKPNKAGWTLLMAAKSFSAARDAGEFLRECGATR